MAIFKYAAGVAGTVTFTGEVQLVEVQATGGAGAGSVVIFGGPSIVVPASGSVRVSAGGGEVGSDTPTIVFAGTASYVVSWLT